MNIEMSESLIGEILEYKCEKYIVTSYNSLNGQTILTNIDDINRLNIRSIIDGISKSKNNFKPCIDKMQYIRMNGRTYKKIHNGKSFTLEPLEGEVK